MSTAAGAITGQIFENNVGRVAGGYAGAHIGLTFGGFNVLVRHRIGLWLWGPNK